MSTCKNLAWVKQQTTGGPVVCSHKPRKQIVEGWADVPLSVLLSDSPAAGQALRTPVGCCQQRACRHRAYTPAAARPLPAPHAAGLLAHTCRARLDPRRKPRGLRRREQVSDVRCCLALEDQRIKTTAGTDSSMCAAHVRCKGKSTWEARVVGCSMQAARPRASRGLHRTVLYKMQKQRRIRASCSCASQAGT